MKLSEEEVQSILQRVRKEPQTVQEISHLVDRSWVTTEKYLQELQQKTGQIALKTFREGTQAALKIVYFVPTELTQRDEVKQHLLQRILQGKHKEDFDFMDMFQFVHANKKKAYTDDVRKLSEEHWDDNIFLKAKKNAYFFSGNMSFLRRESTIEIIEQLLEQGIHIKILCRVNLSSLNNIEKISQLLVKYSNQIEIRHRYHPLRGVVLDDALARFKTEENPEDFRTGELSKKSTVYYEIYDEEWVNWIQQVFWTMWRASIPYDQRIKEIRGIGQ